MLLEKWRSETFISVILLIENDLWLLARQSKQVTIFPVQL